MNERVLIMVLKISCYAVRVIASCNM